jgi:hypothetical protein
LVASGGDFSAALVGAFTGGAAGYVGTYGSGLKGVGFSQTEKVLAHGAVGGLSSKAQGGKFGSGFISSAFSKMVSGKVNNAFKGKPVIGGIAVAMVDGTASALGGGKFSNGARTATIQFLFNELASDRPDLHKRIREKAADGTIRIAPTLRETSDFLSEYSRATGYAATTSLAVGLAPVAGIAGGASFVSGVGSSVTDWLDHLINGSNLNETALVGTGLSIAHDRLAKGVIPMVPGPIKPAVTMGLDMISRAQSEAMYQASKND